MLWVFFGLRDFCAPQHFIGLVSLGNKSRYFFWDLSSCPSSSEAVEAKEQQLLFESLDDEAGTFLSSGLRTVVVTRR